MYHVYTEQVASTRPTNWERCAAEKCFDREEKTRDTRHTSHEIQEGWAGMLQYNGNNQLAEGEKLWLLYFKQKIQLSVERRGMLVKSQIT